MTIWKKFEDPVWRKQAEQKTHKGIGGTWSKEDGDTKKQKQHKLKVKDWLFKSNLTEELLLNHPTPDDVKFFMDIRQLDIWDYFDSSDIAKLAQIERKVVSKRKSLSQENLKFINDSISRAKRLQHRNIKRQGMFNGKKAYEDYKLQVKKVYSNTK